MSKAYLMTREREYGFKPKLGTQDSFYKSLYSSMFKLTNCDCGRDGDQFGSIFNFGFAPDSSILVSACEKRAVILWDPVTLKEIKVVENAHRDCVNCIKFLDCHTFATCSDDSTIALWDLRNLKDKVGWLNGHSNWVKSIEYDPERKLLISASFDGNVYTWPLNTSGDTCYGYNKVLRTSGLMRCQLSADLTKLVMCTTGGFLIVVHNLDLETLGKDLEGFKPNIFRLMQMGRQHIPAAAYYKHLFCRGRSRNRVELISDFPEENDAEVISSVQIHPQGWCAFSRNISEDESSEWSCVHDIRTFVDGEELSDGIPDWQSVLGDLRPPQTWDQDENHSSTDLWEAVLTIRDQRTRRINTANRNTNPQHQFMHYIGRISSGLVGNSIRNPPSEASSDMNAPSTSNGSTGNNSASPPDNPDPLIGTPYYDSIYYNNRPRLLRYIPEANIGRGFIKESSFSPDGRVISSPFGYGVRLLSFNEQCQEYPIPSSEPPKELTSLCHSNCHKNVVISTKFSPKHSYFVSGCLNGDIILHNPVL